MHHHKKSPKYQSPTPDIPYTNVASKNQLSTLINHAPLLLQEALPKSLEGGLKLIKDEVAKGSNDETIYLALRTLHKSKQKTPTDHTLINKYRIKSRVNDLSSFITPQFKSNVKSYLDFGGGDGVISSGIADWIKLNKEQAFSADINEWYSGMLSQDQNEQPNITFATIKDNKLPFANKQFNLITAFVSLHHIEDITTSLKEISRVSNNDCIFIIREHDCQNNITRMIIDVIHSIYELVLNDKDPDPTYLDKYFAKYMTKFEWTKLIEKHGFKYLKLTYPIGKKNDPQHIYYAAYIKI